MMMEEPIPVSHSSFSWTCMCSLLVCVCVCVCVKGLESSVWAGVRLGWVGLRWWLQSTLHSSLMCQSDTRLASCGCTCTSAHLQPIKGVSLIMHWLQKINQWKRKETSTSVTPSPHHYNKELISPVSPSVFALISPACFFWVIAISRLTNLIRGRTYHVFSSSDRVRRNFTGVYSPSTLDSAPITASTWLEAIFSPQLISGPEA